MIKTIYLSPSVQENNIGVGNFRTEEFQMQRVADTTERILKEHEVQVFRNRPEWNLSKIVKDSNRKNPMIHLAIHSNSYDKKSRGCEVFCHRFGGEGERLARLIYEYVADITPTDDRGVKKGYNFYGQGKHMYELNKTVSPAALVEVAFHDNTADAKWILENIEIIGEAIAKGVLRYFDIPIKDKNITFDKALMILQKHGVINTPEYWKQNALKGKQVNGEYAKILIKRVATLL